MYQVFGFLKNAQNSMTVNALALLAGNGLLQQLEELPSYPWLLTGVALAGLSLLLRYWSLWFFLCGFLWTSLYAEMRLTDRLQPQFEGRPVRVTGYIADLPKRYDQHSRFDFIVTDASENLPSKLKLSWYHPEQALKAGQSWSFTVKLKQPHGTLNPGGFDYERWLFSEGIGATGYVRPEPKPVLVNPAGSKQPLIVWRQTLADHLEQVISGSSTGNLIKALTIGDDQGISAEQWNLFRTTGTTHLVVISGSHISLIAGLVYFLALRIWAWSGCLLFSPPKVAAFSAMLAALYYSALAGFSIPTQRALIMLVMVMTALIQQRNFRPDNVLAIALMTILVYDPLATLSAGFWLSFTAVAIIFYIIDGRLAKPSYFMTLIKINWGTSIGLAPLLLAFFQQITLIAPVANLIAVPLISLFIVPLSLLAVLLIAISPAIAQALLLPVGYCLNGLVELLSALANIPTAAINRAAPPIWTLVFAIPGALWLLAPKGIPARWLGLILFIPLLFPPRPPKPSAMLSLTLLDVGQGLSAVVTTAHHVLVFDAGAKFANDSDLGKTVILPFLHNQGIGQIDHLFVSHGDNDHIGGAESLLQGIPVKQLSTSVPDQLSEHRLTTCQNQQTWNWDQVQFTVLSPPSARFQSENDNSCVLKIESAQGNLLLTGDIEAEAELWLVKNHGKKLAADILVAPHHGSKTSSSPAFLQAVRPQMVLIPAGYRNQFGHPHPAIVKRYQDLRAKWFNTAASGAISCTSQNQGWQVTTQRVATSKYWNFK